MVTFIFSALDWKYALWANWSKKSNSSVENEPWYLDWLEYSEFDSDI